MSALVEFLLARITEEVAARENSIYYSSRHPVTGERMQWGTDEEVAKIKLSDWWRRSVAECASKRKITELHASDGGDCRTCAGDEDFSEDSEGNRDWYRSAKPFPCETLLALAAPYSGHPDYPGEDTQP